MTFPPVIRSGPSGPRAVPANPLVMFYSWTAPATITILPEGHAAGLYLVSTSVFQNVAAGAGNFTSAFQWTQPDFGPATLAFGSVALTATGLIFQVTRTFESTGQAPIRWFVTPAGATGTPSARIALNASILSES